ncbi:multicopper oxidase [Trichosporon asahii var. asahii CBS 2479]|uniref:Multicopper oxidase n=1 Tax=Trichosporon asahii var. asahii (strain ATCC 90039 / CBS 2479 / JCM 2466 / KCTC 7840 / NBRC 103889/ NCYC 2677 / UAMH 7654) TaxID=1186058 RepID=J6EV61_TRIAS|nr:multicopper oxidase [Trichosporon asahii var. asahii CBS 2479]EJT46677.1 multicopper oxidase [Trichosporon asahii var. asahii CBS 2479]
MSDASAPVEKTTEPHTRKAGGGNARRNRWIAAGIVAFLCVAIGVGVGVGVGVGTKRHKSPEKSANASAGETLANGTTTTEISREQLLGDQARWLGSSRQFPVGAAPTTREFNWTVSAVSAAPGGMTKPMIVVNGLLPGRGFMDGTHGITQCGIPPGSSFTYEWVAEQGTSWYHAHSAGQYTDGLIGAIVFHPASTPGSNSSVSTRDAQPEGNEGNEPGTDAKYDDEVTLMLSDMYNTPVPALSWRFTALGTGIDGQPGDEPSPDGGSINGVSQAKCAYIPQSDLVIPERKRRRSLHALPPQAPQARSYTHGTHYDASNYCGDEPTTFFNLTLEGGKTYRLRLVNAGSFVNTIFSVDGHALTVVEADGVAIQPFNASSVELAVGQRYSVLITLDQPPAAYWVRNHLQTSEMRYTSPNFSETTLGVLRYAGISSSILPNSTTGGEDESSSGSASGSARGLPALDPDGTKLTPVHAPDAPRQREEQYTVQFNMQYTADNGHYMFFNDSSWEPEPGVADIFKIRNDASFASASRVGPQDGAGDQVNIVTPGPTPGPGLTQPSSNSSNLSNDAGAGFVDLIVNSLDDGSHPFHMHGHRFWVLSSGDGHFVGDSSSLNTTSIMRRDTLQIPSYGHAVLRLGTGNAGVWAFHCHISWHMQLGLLMTLTHRPDEIRKWTLPEGFEGMCAGEKTPAADSGAQEMHD